MIVVEWYVDDGFMTGDRPQYIELEYEDVEGMSDNEIDDLLSSIAREEFEANITYEVSETAVSEIRDYIEMIEADDEDEDEDDA